MDILEELLGLRDRRRQSRRGSDDVVDNLFDTVGGLVKWLLGCGCALVVALVGGIVILVAAGIVNSAEEVILIVIVAATIIAAMISLARITLSSRFPGT